METATRNLDVLVYCCTSHVHDTRTYKTGKVYFIVRKSTAFLLFCESYFKKYQNVN